MQERVYREFHNIVEPDINSRIPDCEKLHRLGFNFELKNGFDSLIFSKI